MDTEASSHKELSQVDAELAELLAELAHRLQSGQPVDLDAFLRSHARYASQLERLIPTMITLAQLGRTESYDFASSQDTDVEGHSSESALRQIGDFRIQREIGRGGMGVVYEAEQASLGRRVALKILPFAALLNERQLERFKTEATAAARLQHPHIVPIYTVGCERGIHFYTMQLIDGPSLAEVIAQLRRHRAADGTADGTAAAGQPSCDHDTVDDAAPEPLTLDVESDGYYRAVARLGREAAEALHHAHQHGVLHRDIKPSNLLLDAAGHIWIADFGLARVEDESQLTLTGDILGTLRYMSPEQATGQRDQIDARTDVYSLGATLYELATLRPPFDTPDRRQMIQQVVAGDPAAPHTIDRRVPRPLGLIIGQSLARRPEDRYQSAHQLAEDLQRFLDGQPVKARPAPLRRRAKKLLRSRRVAVVFGLTLLTTVALGIAYVSTRPGSPSPPNAARTRPLTQERNALDDTTNGDLTMLKNTRGKRTSRSAISRPTKNGRNRSLAHEQLEDRRLLSFGYADFSDTSELNLVGDTDVVGDVLRLTGNTAYQGGTAWYQELQPVSLGFETTFAFQLTGRFGFAFVIQNDEPFAMGDWGGMVYGAMPNSLAIEFDTYADTGLWWADDPNDSHVSVHTTGVYPNSAHEAFSLGSFLTSDSLWNGEVHTATIRYDAGLESLEIYVDDEALSIPDLTIPLDLPALLDLDAGRAWVGFTATTAPSALSTHDILTWEFTTPADTMPAIAISDVRNVESADGGSSEFIFSVQRIGSSTGTVNLEWNTIDGTAHAGSDYVAATDTLTIPDGVSEETISVTVLGDSVREGREEFFVELTNVQGALLADGHARGTILENAPNASLELAGLLESNGGDGSRGFVLGGLNVDHYSMGSSQWISSAGDVNGDGFDDMVVGATREDAGSVVDAGKAYVVFGTAGGFPASIDPDTLDGVNGFIIEGNDLVRGVGYVVNAAGDVNGDGIDDLVMMNSQTEPQTAARVVVFGRRDGFPAQLDLSTLDGQTGFRISAPTWGGMSGGDINGDGFNDVIVGAAGFVAGAPCGFVIFGKPSGYPAEVDAMLLDGTNGFIMRSVHNGWTGWNAAAAGDVNGDGFEDLILAAVSADTNGVDSGEAYVVFGKAGGFPSNLDLASLDGTNGFVVRGASAGDALGYDVRGLGDVNGDGFDDIIVGSGKGTSYLILGRAGGFLPAFSVSTLDGTNGLAIRSVDNSDLAGLTVSGAGDVNGDGFDDVIIGAYNVNTDGLVTSGESYVVYGRDGGLPAEMNLAELDGMNGFVVLGIDPYERSGVSEAGDVDGDGFADIIVAATSEPSDGFTRSGQAYVVLGSDRTGAVTHAGGADSDLLTGDATANVIVGGQANDTLLGNGGADVLIGGEGDDSLVIADTTFRRIVGGNGSDTLRLDGAGLTLDLTSVPDNRILGIEEIDITGSGDNTLTLNRLEVLNISDTSNTLIVRADPGDTINMGGSWLRGGAQMIGSDLFAVYTQGAARLLVQSHVPLTMFSDSFEDGQWNGLWTEDGQNSWYTSNQRSTDGSYAAAVAGRAVDAAINSTPIDLTLFAGAEVALDWYIESGLDNGEYVALDLFDGSTWTEAARLSGNIDPENVWHTVTIPVDGAYLVDNFQLRFRGKMNKSDEVANVDNVRVLATSLAGPPNQLPSADAGGPYTGSEEGAITFNAGASLDPDGAIVTYTWDFGDGTVPVDTSQPTINYSYLWGGTFDVTVTVTDDRGGTASDTTTATIAEVNDPPVADPAGPYDATVHVAVDFDGNDSFDFDNLDGTTANDQTLSYSWDFGDGSDPATGATVAHTYTTAGTYIVTLTVGDTVDTDVATTTVQVTDEPMATTLHVSDLDGDRNDGSLGRFWEALVTITVVDDSLQPVAGATVTGTWSGNASGTAIGTTDLAGQVTVVSPKVLDKKESVIFTVDTIEHMALTYDPSANSDPDGDSTGTTIVVLRVPPASLRAADRVERVGSVPALTAAQAQSVASQALALWSWQLPIGLPRDVQVQVADLPADTLGWASGSTIVLDLTADGAGWYLDTGPAAGRVDLLTAVSHEIGHLLGYEHTTSSHDVMAPLLPVGTRRLPVPVPLPDVDQRELPLGPATLLAESEYALLVPPKTLMDQPSLPAATRHTADVRVFDDLADEETELIEEDLLDLLARRIM